MSVGGTKSAMFLDGNSKSPELHLHLTACSDCRELLEELQADRCFCSRPRRSKRPRSTNCAALYCTGSFTARIVRGWPLPPAHCCRSWSDSLAESSAPH